MDTLDPTQFLGIAGAGAIITALVEAFKRFLRWTEDDTNRIAPLFSIALGVLIFVAFTAVNPVAGVELSQAIFNAILTGIVAGATAAGIYQLGGKAVIRGVAGEPDNG
jgi:hypothetical protein